MSGELNKEERLRYSRHLILPEVGLSGQLKLREAKVLLIGMGGLGSPSALYLAASGIGTLGIVDFDQVDLSNLHRQVIHGTGDLGKRKIDSGAESINDVNPHVQVIKHEVALSSENALQIIGDYDYVVDGTDNFPTRYLVNDACVLLGKPNIYGSIFRFEGQASIFCIRGYPCYRCLYPEPPPPGTVPSCAEGGVLGVLPGVIGLIQATETVKAILGIGESLAGRLMLYDALSMQFSEVKISRDPDCPICGDRPSIKALIDYEDFCGIKSTESNRVVQEIDTKELYRMMENGEEFALLDVREPHEHETIRIAGSTLIPLAKVQESLAELDSEKPIVVHCHSGRRSAQACELLEQNGFTRVINLKGGIQAWSADGYKTEPD